jgi:hypothetical protein
MTPAGLSPPRQRLSLARRVLLPLMALCAACADGQPPAAASAGATVETLVGDAACDSDAQCRTIGVGAKACGGPQRFIAWSTSRTDGDALRIAAEREAKLERAKAQASGLMSNCAVVQDPGAYCALADAGLASGPAGQGASVRRCRVRSLGIGGAGRIY